MKSDIRISCLLAALGLLAACSSTPSSTGGPAATPDAADTQGADGSGLSDSLLSDTTPGPDAAVPDTAGADANGLDSAGIDGAAGDVASAKYPTCVAVTDCVIDACTPTPTADCQSGCLGGGSQDALEKALPLLTCIQGKCQDVQCKNSTDPKCVSNCIGATCTPELIGCVDNGQSGTDACGDALGCFDACGQGSNYFSCMGTCYAKLSSTGKTALSLMTACMGKAAQAGKDPNQACIGEMMGCLTGGKSGTKECFEVFSCQDKCPGGDNTPCIAACLSEVSAAGQKAFIDVLPCVGDSAKMAEPDCVKKLTACINPSGQKTCAQTLSCETACQAEAGGKDATACNFACAHDATPAAAEALNKVAVCGIADKTPAQAQACADAMIGCANPSGTDACPAIMTCAQACGANSSQDCVFGCLAKGSVAGATAFGKLMSCKDGCDAQCTNSTDNQCSGKCMGTTCAATLAACSPPT